MSTSRRSNQASGTTLIELMVGFAVFTLLMALLAVAIQRGRAIWNRAGSNSSSQLQLRKSFVPLSTELQRTRFDTVRRADGPASLAGFDGDAVWFLSAVNPASGLYLRTDDGGPRWQRNILFYTVVPQLHDQTFGITCTGGTDSDGYEMYCPHKVLVKKVIDNPPGSADPLVGSPDQELLSDVTPYLTRPQGFDPAAGSEKGVESATIVARDLLTFRVRLEPDANRPGEVLVMLESVRVDEARRSVRVGSSPLDQYSQSFTFSAFPPSP